MNENKPTSWCEAYKDTPTNFEVRAIHAVGTVGWLVANTTGQYGWYPWQKSTVFWFEKGEDAVAFKLRFGL